MRSFCLAICLLFFSFSKAQDDLVGTWEGTMSNKKLQIVIQENVDDKVKGYNILGKNKRPVKGTVKYIDRGGECLRGIYCTVILKEPGDDKWDGVFNAYFYTGIGEGDGRFYIAQGKWGANNGKLNHEFTIYKD